MMMDDSVTDRLPVSHFDTAALPEAERFEAWRKSIGVLFDVELDGRRPERKFDASLKTYHLDSLLIAGCKASAQAFERSALKVSNDGMDHYLIQIFISGRVDFSHGGKELVARPGDIWVNDLTSGYASTISDYENLSLVVPRNLISGNLSQPDGQGQRVIPGDQPMARLFKRMMSAFFETAPDMTAKDALLTVSPMLRMAEGLLNSGEGGALPDMDETAIDQAALVGIKRFIDERLTDPALRPDMIVAEMGVSRSSLYRLFEPLGGVAAHIRACRLRRSVRDLLDPAMRKRRIYEIAHAWGFEREGDYSRAFRRQYGVTPREARAAGMLSMQDGATIRGPFGDRNYETWLRDLSWV